MGLTSKAEKTRQFIIENSAQLFNKKRYVGTSLTDITEATKLTKGSIYGNFDDKDEVAKAVYKYNSDMLMRKISEVLNRQQSAIAKLTALTEFYKKNWTNINSKGGCPLMNSAIEADDNLPYLKNTIKKSFVSWADSLNEIIEAGIRDGEFKENMISKDYSNTFIMIIEGAILLSKITDNPVHLETGLNRVLYIIENEMKR